MMKMMNKTSYTQIIKNKMNKRRKSLEKEIEEKNKMVF